MAIVVTGAAGFIGSCLVSFLNKKGVHDVILVDDFSKTEKSSNLEGKEYSAKIDRDVFLEDIHRHKINFIFHIGARTDTTEFDTSIFDKLNESYSKALWQHCSDKNIPFLYASSAATYGDGKLGFNDTKSIKKLKPLNPYGESKQNFDTWALKQSKSPPFWVGLKFFNVFGPNEYHKGRMASVVMHAFNQIKENGSLNLFQSHNPEYKDGEQIRDFIYVKDLLELMWFWYNKQSENGIYNAGTGKARTFNDLANAIFLALHKTPQINYIPTPEDIRDKYQYFTEATMQKSIDAGFNTPFHSLEDAVSDYVNNYLVNHSNY
ncbi:MAG: ADP-glyceromanno-heptose 6-epimerase [Bacteroidia bacterium]|nr:ADP-glyceromanno-heptose 6-epimerase [Bacteroidia bacterium]NNJ54930.1 ADP-glyceromanno-heptose 6-epimerase [Bacteroidia bacterium]